MEDTGQFFATDEPVGQAHSAMGASVTPRMKNTTAVAPDRKIGPVYDSRDNRAGWNVIAKSCCYPTHPVGWSVEKTGSASSVPIGYGPTGAC